jgi:hypothetical protein
MSRRGGYYEVQNSGCPAFVNADGRTIIRADEHFESETRTCCGCQRVVILRANRDRPRNYCRQCDSFMCDDCALSFKITGEHKSFDQIADEYLEAASRGLIMGVR